MEKIRNFLNIEENIYSTKILFLLVIVAYLFSIAVRWIWVGYAEDIPQFMWNGQIMINTNDGYAWAEGARDILSGTHQPHDGSFIDYPPSQLTAFLAQILPISFETLILYLPAFLGALLVIPIVLIGRLLKQDLLGFVAGLLAGITWSYYNRTMIGYYDTDMLSIVLPTFLLWAILSAVVYKENRYLLITTLIVITYQWWYEQSYSLNMGMLGALFLYTIVFDRKNSFNYKLMSFIFIGMLLIPAIFKIVLGIALFLFFYFYKDKAEKFILPILLITLLLLLVTGGLTPILHQLQGYIFRDSVSSGTTTGLSLHYFNVVQTVREAGNIPFETFANRISGSVLVFVLSSLGYLLLAFRYRVMWLALPMIGLGFLALKGGLRFTVYAVPINALGISFLILLVAQQFKEKWMKYGFISLMSIGVFYPNVQHVINYKVPTVFQNKDVKVLNQLKGIAQREDYVIAWWDYGYPIRYYADVKTLIDGARHSGNGNFPVSFSLLNDPVSAANMSRTYTEYVEKSYLKERNVSIFQAIMKDYNFKHVSSLLSALKSKKFKRPKKTRDIYFYLPLQMMGILPTIDLFSNLNLETGKGHKKGVFFRTQPVSNVNGVIQLRNGIVINQGMVTMGNSKVPMNQLIVTEYDKHGVLHKNAQLVNIGAPIYVIYMKNYNQFLILDKRMYNSLFIQLFVLENYDPELFEPTILTPLTKIFKLKI